MPPAGPPSARPPAAVAALPWGHNLLLLEKPDDPALRAWYVEQATRHGWSRNVLAMQVGSRLHARVGRADQTTNFAATLPPAQSDLARAVAKDPYDFEFLAVAQDAHGRHVEARLLAHMREFRLELGTGFLYAGSQYRLVVGGDEFFLDLLFYHKRLRCWVVIDLGTGEFRPEYAGQMHFYPNVVDEQLRDAGGNFSYNDRACGGASRPDPGPPVCPPCHAMGHAVQSPCHTRGSQWPMPGSISCAVVWTC